MALSIVLGGVDQPVDLALGEVFTRTARTSLHNCYIFWR
jgi:hypothetical protein